MRKLFALLLILTVTVSFVSCFDINNNGDASNTTESQTEAQSDSENIQDTDSQTESESLSESSTESESESESETNSGSYDNTELNMSECESIIAMADGNMQNLEKYSCRERIIVYLGNEVVNDTTEMFICNSGNYFYSPDYTATEKSVDITICDNIAYFDENNIRMHVTDEEIEYLLSEDSSASNYGLKYLFDSISGKRNDDGSITIKFKDATVLYKNVLNDLNLGIDFNVKSVELIMEISKDMLYTSISANVDMSADVSGTMRDFVSKNTTYYEYNPEIITHPAKANEYEIYEFEDIFGFISNEPDPQVASELGLALEGMDSYSFDYQNQELLYRQFNFVNAYQKSYYNKPIKVIGTYYYDYDTQTDYILLDELGQISFPIDVENGPETIGIGTFLSAIITLKLDLSKLAISSVRINDLYYYYYYEVSDVKEISPNEIPQAGYLPWVAFITAESYLNIRSTPDFDADNVVGYYKRGDEIKVIGGTFGDYYMVNYNGKVCYIGTRYVSKLPAID